jgi:hypothetical protein
VIVMTPPLRKLALTAHVIVSVGWLGAVAAFLILAIAGLACSDDRWVRGAYLAMDLMTWSLIVPFCVASLLTGILQSLGTGWGLLRHYWVLLKLLLTMLATILLLVHARPIGYVASVAAEVPFLGGQLRDVRIQLVADAAAALLVLVTATALSVYKPQGVTPYGWRRRQSQPMAS